ncbi:MAG: hypothetical protein JST16_03570 [Bdellovibrionales bacterium]|nr:hypothetical protein [Bdellovibrionales bacterium]
MHVRLRHHATGLIRECPTGFSWTSFFFGFFVPLLRSWYGFAAIYFCVSIVTGGLSQFVLPFLINKMWMKHLLENGYTPHSDEDRRTLALVGLHVDPIPPTFTNKVA